MVKYMSSFTSDLIVKKVGDMIWEVYTPFEYHVGKEDSTDIIKVPKGFQSDFASIPRLFWMILPPDGEYTGASIIHDFLYFIQDRSRVTCDKIFLEAMLVLGVSLWKRRIMYRAVRLFGWMPWNNKAREKNQKQEGSMKKAILAVLFLALNVGSAFAGIEGVASAKLDMPNLVKFSEDVTFGIEAGKDLYNIRSDDQSFWTEDDKGYYGVAKLTVKWTLLNFAKN